MRHHTDSNIIFIDFNDLEYENSKNYQSLYQYVKAHYKDSQNNILIIDEIQFCDHFELAINSLHNGHQYDIYIIGSNAFLLSSDLSTLFTGRYIEIPVFTFSFAEYCQYYEINGLSSDSLDHYLIQGGFAGSYLYHEEEDRMAYIRNVYNTIIKRDLVDKYHISDISLFDSLASFLMDNISNLTSANKISALLNKNNAVTNHVTIGNYLKYLCNAFMFYKVKRYDVRGKKYLGDMDMRYALLGKRDIDYENLIALELLRRGYDRYVGKLYQKEIDFAAMKHNEKFYMQVSDDISSQNTLERELLPLQSIKDAYPKLLIANTKHEAYDIEGIQIIDIADWLLNV